MSRLTSRFFVLPIVCLMAGFGLVACGSDNSSDSSSDSSSVSTAATSSTSDSGTSSTADSGSGDTLEELFFTTIRQQIEKQGLSPEVASCVENNLRDSITQEELDQLKTGSQPPTLSQKATEAGTACAQQALGQ